MRGRRVGAIGDFTCFSLYATKSLAGGEGGIITTASAERGRAAAAAARRTASPATRGSGRGRTRSATTTSSSPASRPTWPTCRPPRRCRSSTGSSASTPTAPSWSARYDDGLAALAGIEPIGRPAYGRHAHHLYVVRIDPAPGRRRPRPLRGRARWPRTSPPACTSCPCTRSPGTAATCPCPALPVTELAGAQVLSLPLAAAHSDADIDDAVAAVRKVHAALTAVRIDRRTRVAVEAVVSAVVLGLLLRWAGHPRGGAHAAGHRPGLVPAGRRRQRRRRSCVMALRWQLLLAAKARLGAARLARRAPTSSPSSPASSCPPRSAATPCAWSSSAGAPATRPRRSRRC